MWGLESQSSKCRSQVSWQSLGLISKFEPGLGGYGLVYITGTQTINQQPLNYIFVLSNFLQAVGFLLAGVHFSFKHLQWKEKICLHMITTKGFIH